jgi:hypothetical protein
MRINPQPAGDPVNLAYRLVKAYKSIKSLASIFLKLKFGVIQTSSVIFSYQSMFSAHSERIVK